MRRRVEQAFAIAKLFVGAARFFRGGAYKPRVTLRFPGPRKGLANLATFATYGLKIVTEAWMNQGGSSQKYGDMIRIGAKHAEFSCCERRKSSPATVVEARTVSNVG